MKEWLKQEEMETIFPNANAVSADLFLEVIRKQIFNFVFSGIF